MNEKRALCVGINQFKNYPAAALQGCVNDAHNMSELLQKLFQFKAEDITVLTDAQATKANIMNQLKSMVDGAKAGNHSHLVFSFSSHGTQVPDLSRDEPDRADEAFCPHDLAEAGNQWDPSYIIADDELRDLFVQLPPNVLLEVYLDTCHCGTGLRAIDLFLNHKPRYLPPPSWDAFEAIDSKRSRGLRHGLLEKGLVHHILWAACRADQTSADAKIGGSWTGAFTHYLCKELYACQNALPRKDVLARVRAALKADHFTQIPQLEGEATKRREIPQAA